ncbi:MAG TPA: DUF4157 domain-containing protein [Burkholderiales bacterium]|nr:DUF4157 domain-containing protein [Burkholderiales bacterium]
MAQDRTAARVPAVERRPAAAAAAQRSAAAMQPSSARALQQRLGNQAMHALVSRSIAAPAQARTIQRFARISSPGEPAEAEAHDTARQVMRMVAPAALEASATPAVQRAAAQTPAPAPPVPAAAHAGAGGGAPLPAGVRSFMEPRFGADFSEVRVHTDEAAAQHSAALDAHAFTAGRHVYFGRNKFQPDSAAGQELIAHELTHTIQQGAAVQRSADTAVAQRSQTRIQRWGIGDARGYIADKANYLPGFRLLTIVLGMNPISLVPVEPGAANLLRALLELIPVTGALLAQALDKYGVFARVGAWVEVQVRTLGLAAGTLKRALDAFLASLHMGDVLHVGDVWERGKRIFTEPIERLLAFGQGLAGDILRFIREAVLLPLARLAEGTRGYDLLKAVLGQDPITGQAVPRTPDTLIGGFMKLIGQEEVWENLKKANAVARAWAWFQGALAGLLGFVRQIPALFLNALRSLELVDLLILPKAFLKLADVFGGFVVRFLSWAGNAVWTLLEIIFEVVSPAALSYIKRTGAALGSILRNPLPFVRNLVAAAKLGFRNFAEHFGAHLKAGLIDWLTGSLPGVYIPKAFSLGEIVKFVFSVLGLTWQNVRPKLVKVVGETAVQTMETGFDIVVTLVTQGPAAAWDKIQEHLTNLKDMVIGGITDFVIDIVVKKAVPKLVAMFIPGAGFISAIVSIYDTIMVFVDKLAKMVEVVTGFIDSLVAIAAGAIGAAAKRVESTLAGILSLAISFLAGFIGLGNVAEKVMGVILKVRASVDKALDALIAWIVMMAKKLFRMAKGAAGRVLEWWKLHKVVTTPAGDVTVSTEGSEDATEVVIAASPGKRWAAYVKDLKGKATTPAQMQALQDAQALVAIIESKRGRATTAEDRAKVAEEHAEKVETSFNKLVDHIKIINGKAAVPASVIEYGGTDAKGGGIEVKASILSSIHPVGSGPSDNADIWNALQDLGKGSGRQIRGQWYVQGHLLNENLGGPGLRFNLTPITKEANNEHKSAVETDLKDLVNDKGAVISYTVKALAGPPKGKNPRRTELESKAKLSKAEQDELVSVKALENLTRGFKCTAYILEQDSAGKWTKKGKALDKASKTIDNDIERGGKTYGY